MLHWLELPGSGFGHTTYQYAAAANSNCNPLAIALAQPLWQLVLVSRLPCGDYWVAWSPTVHSQQP
jgi:hypothetical protein